MSLARALAEFAVSAEPPAALEAIVGPAVADCFACILTGANSEVAERLYNGIGRVCVGDSPLFGTNFNVSPSAAALINAAAGHAYDLDDWEEPGNTHPTVVMLPALLALASMRTVSGRDMFNAYCVGFETICRLGEAVTMDHYSRGFHSTATLGAIGSAASVSRALRLDRSQTLHGMALATSQACGYTVQFGSNAKPFQAGIAARAGLEAALFAAAGGTGREKVIEDERGFFGLMGNSTEKTRNDALKQLADPWALEAYGIILKPWPSCGYTHRLMTAALTLRNKGTLDLSEVTRIQAVLPDFHRNILPYDRPENRNQALFSAPACIAQVLVHGDLTLIDSSQGFWCDKEIARLIEVTEVIGEPANNPHLNYDPDQPDRLDLWFNDGSVARTQCTYPLGAPQNPMGKAELADKFCGITGQDAERFEQLLNWIDAPDIATFFREFAACQT